VLLVDTNVWVAAQDPTDPNTTACQALLRARMGTLCSPVTVITETAWFIESRQGTAAEAQFLGLITIGALVPIEMGLDDWARTTVLVTTYASLGLGTVDASIVAVAERLGLTEIATMNTRDFYTVKPAHCPGFTLLAT
jgi:uncharacterized protein